MSEVFDPNQAIQGVGSQRVNNPVIKVIGVGGCGNKALQLLIVQGIRGVEFIAVDSELESPSRFTLCDLERSIDLKQLQIGPKLTQASELDVDGDLYRGYLSAEESKEELQHLTQGADVVVILAGLGGGTGSGALPVIAEIANAAGAVTFAVVSCPFHFEGKKQRPFAEISLEWTAKKVDCLFVIDKEKMIDNSESATKDELIDVFRGSVDHISYVVRSLVRSLMCEGLVGLNLSELKTVLSCGGTAVVGQGKACGANFVVDAMENAINSPLLESGDIKLASGILVHALVSRKFTSEQVDLLKMAITEHVSDAAQIKYAVTYDDRMQADQCEITILVSGLPFRFDAGHKSISEALWRSNPWRYIEKHMVMDRLASAEAQAKALKEAGAQVHKDLRIKVLGVGGGAGNVLQYMINHGFSGAEVIAVNTDKQALDRLTVPTKLQIGPQVTCGLGAGCDPCKGYAAAIESKEELKQLVQGADLVVIVAGIGGGTGSGASPVIAELAKEAGAATIAVVTAPFNFEGKKHRCYAECSIGEISTRFDATVVCDDQIYLVVERSRQLNLSIIYLLNVVNDLVFRSVQCIVDTIRSDSLVNLTLGELQSVLSSWDKTVVGLGEAQGANFIADAVQKAVEAPMLEQGDLKTAAGILVCARVSRAFTRDQVEVLKDAVSAYVDAGASVKYAVSFDEQLQDDQCVVTIFVSGLPFRLKHLSYQDYIIGNQPVNVICQREIDVL